MVNNDKIHYRRNMLIAIIIGEVLIIFAFIFSPHSFSPDKILLQNDKIISRVDIPVTVQMMPPATPPPKVPSIPIANEVSAFEILEDVSVTSNTNGQDDNIISDDRVQDNNIQPARSAPRLIYEVVPSEGDNELNGKLQLSLKIDKDGKVIDHQIISNSLDCDKCLNDIIRSAYKSKWEPAVVNGRKEDFWVVKSYTFN